VTAVTRNARYTYTGDSNGNIVAWHPHVSVSPVSGCGLVVDLCFQHAGLRLSASAPTLPCSLGTKLTFA
jgi:hypothetical protein